jgi:hypothetical protein
MNSFLHIFAGVLLSCFSVSHFGFLTLKHWDFSLGLANPVFPFLTNSNVYLMAGLLEGVTGILCIVFRGRDLVNWAILTFVAVILCYRWAFSFFGWHSLQLFGTFRQIVACKQN